jgi:hypothetical protein
MKVDISRGEGEKGLFKKTKYYSVGISVSYTEEEKAIIKKRGIGDTVVCEWESDDPRFGICQVTINDFTKQSWGKTFPNPVAAQSFAEELKEDVQRLKAFIDASAKDAKSESFEL